MNSLTTIPQVHRFSHYTTRTTPFILFILEGVVLIGCEHIECSQEKNGFEKIPPNFQIILPLINFFFSVLTCRVSPLQM